MSSERWQKVRVAFRAMLGPSSGASWASMRSLMVGADIGAEA
jgi:hypothetical protein